MGKVSMEPALQGEMGNVVVGVERVVHAKFMQVKVQVINTLAYQPLNPFVTIVNTPWVEIIEAPLLGIAFQKAQREPQHDV